MKNDSMADDRFSATGWKTMYYDEERGQGTRYADEEITNTFDDMQVRKAFIQRVYFVLTIMLLLTFSIVFVFVFVQEVDFWVKTNSWFLWMSLAIYLSLMLILVCSGTIRRMFPVNIILMTLMSLACGITVGAASARFDTEAFFIALGSLAAIFAFVTFLATQTKCDFSWVWIIGFIALVLTCGIGIVAIFFQNKILHMIYASIGIIAFSAIILYDTWLIMNGKYADIMPTDHYYASIMLYINVIMLFQYLLLLIGTARSS